MLHAKGKGSDGGDDKDKKMEDALDDLKTAEQVDNAFPSTRETEKLKDYRFQAALKKAREFDSSIDARQLLMFQDTMKEFFVFKEKLNEAISIEIEAAKKERIEKRRLNSDLD